MSAQTYSARDRELMRELGREKFVDTMFDWGQTHLSEYE